jgi:tripartite-type tricarboxylate transporter receptor subunit TctC
MPLRLLHPLRRTLLAAAVVSLTIPFAAVWAQEFPTKTVTIVVPFSPGGGVDTVARLLAEKLRGTLKQTVVVENKPGGSGMIGAMAVVKAVPDGHTLLLGSAGETAINTFVFKNKMQYNPAKDLAPVTLVTRVPNVLVASQKFAANSIDELIAYAKKNEGKVTYSSSGVGNPQHLNGELLEQMVGVKLIHVPYKGAAGQLADLVGGSVDFTFVSYAAARGFLNDGRLKALGVTSAQRAAFDPNIPAIAETKAAAGYALENWFGLFTTAGTPEPVLAKINEAVTNALKDPELAKKLQEQGSSPAPMSVAQFRDFLNKETAMFKRVVETANVTAE